VNKSESTDNYAAGGDTIIKKILLLIIDSYVTFFNIRLAITIPFFQGYYVLTSILRETT
jgi:hypothetical protein